MNSSESGVVVGSMYSSYSRVVVSDVADSSVVVEVGVDVRLSLSLTLIGGKHIEAKRAAVPPVRKGIYISGTDLLIIIRNIFIHSYNFLQILNSFI